MALTKKKALSIPEPAETPRKKATPAKKAVASSDSAPKKATSKSVTEKVSTAKPADEKPAFKAAKSTKPVKTVSSKNDSETSADGYFSLLTDFDIYLFKQGKHARLYDKLGAHLVENHAGIKGTFFAVWAPNASHVSVSGDFNQWNPVEGVMNPRLDGSGIWELFVPGVSHGMLYKYMIRNAQTGHIHEKFDPFGFFSEIPPKRASIVWDLEYSWKSKAWDKQTGKSDLNKPVSVYEVHAGSWRKSGTKEDDYLTYNDLAAQLVPYVKEMGFTHVEFMPLTEHPYAGSWGYQTTGFFAPTSRFGTPQEFMQLVDAFHEAGIGVIIDWVPSHFPEDSFALAQFDGTHLFEHQDPRKGFHPDWKSLIFNYGRYEVRSFLMSSAMFWAEKYKIDGLRVDAVASMLYLDYSRKDGEWETNIYGGNENLDAISFLKELNETLYTNFPEIHVIAEESTSWPMVSRPVYLGGLGFGMKWMMGWMHDTLTYFQTDPVYREYHQNDITFSIYYAFTENFMLPLSHDEVVHGKGSLIAEIAGDQWQRFANLRAMFSMMFMHPGTKLLFMGAEIAQYEEWNYKASLDWHLLDYAPNKGIQTIVKALNILYRSETALYELGFDAKGFQWIDLSDHRNSVISFLRKGKKEGNFLIVICNFTPVPRENYRIGVPQDGSYDMLFNSDSKEFWGSGFNENTFYTADKSEKHGLDYSVAVDLPPLSVVVLKPQGGVKQEKPEKLAKPANLKPVSPKKK